MIYPEIIDRYYPAGSALRDIYIRHCRSVADKALEIRRALSLDIDERDIEEAAMLHDIGIFLTDAAGIECHGTEPYICHGRLGAELLRNNGVPEHIARVAERHTGTGITNGQIDLFGLPLPHGDYMPRTPLERLVCYADKFYSKNGDMKEKSLDRVRASIARHGEDALERFDTLAAEFHHL